MIKNDQLVTNRGRVFGVTAQGVDIAEAREKAYFMMGKMLYKGKHFRGDIAAKALHR